MKLSEIEKSPTVDLLQKVLAEACGTFILVFSVGTTQGTPISVATALWAVMLGTGFVSGGQFNPAVSTAVIVNAILTNASDMREKIFHSVIFMAVQLLSALFAADMAYCVINTNDKALFYFDTSDGIKDSEGFLAEVFFTTVLAGVALIGGTLTKSSILVGGLVATTVAAGDFAIGAYTQGCFNPAVAFGINLIHQVVNGGSTHRLWLYLLANWTGGVLGGVFATMFIKLNKNVKDLRKAQY